MCRYLISPSQSELGLHRYASFRKCSFLALIFRSVCVRCDRENITVTDFSICRGHAKSIVSCFDISGLQALGAGCHSQSSESSTHQPKDALDTRGRPVT